MLMVSEVRRVLLFLTKNGFVNHGILHDVPRSLALPEDLKVGLEGQYRQFLASL